MSSFTILVFFRHLCLSEKKCKITLFLNPICILGAVHTQANWYNAYTFIHFAIPPANYTECKFPTPPSPPKWYRDTCTAPKKIINCILRYIFLLIALFFWHLCFSDQPSKTTLLFNHICILRYISRDNITDLILCCIILLTSLLFTPN